MSGLVQNWSVCCAARCLSSGLHLVLYHKVDALWELQYLVPQYVFGHFSILAPNYTNFIIIGQGSVGLYTPEYSENFRSDYTGVLYQSSFFYMWFTLFYISQFTKFYISQKSTFFFYLHSIQLYHQKIINYDYDFYLEMKSYISTFYHIRQLQIFFYMNIL